MIKTITQKKILELLEQDLDQKTYQSRYYKYINRRSALKKALELTNQLKGKTLIVSTGVGSEQGLTQPQKTMKWDEREVWIDEYLKFVRPKLLK
ncbi:MAG: hypothetical protein HC932_01465 [Thermales bacterium]|nr:hypothetical protein [Thermales bacterium]